MMFFQEFRVISIHEYEENKALIELSNEVNDITMIIDRDEATGIELGSKFICTMVQQK